MLSSRFTLHASRFTLHASRFTLRHAVILFFISFNVIGLNAQALNGQIKDVVMPSPNAASLGKYGDIPVSYYTGVPNVGIPIHTLTEGVLSLPISLSYHAGGVKVGEPSSWVGQNWSLQAGGMISRTVQGKPDESASGYFSSGKTLKIGTTTELTAKIGFAPTSPDTTIVSQCAIDSSDGSLLTNLLTGNSLDGEPDIFSFSINGYSGKFYIDADKTNDGVKNGKVVLIPKQDIDIKFYADPSTTGAFTLLRFTITTPNGVKYDFGSIDNAYSETDDAIELTNINQSNFWQASGWHLKRITSADGLNSIMLNYDREAYRYTYRASRGALAPLLWAVPSPVGGYGQQLVDILGYRLNNVQTSTEKVTFVTGLDRSATNGDLTSSIYNTTVSKPLSLSQIKIENGSFCKTFKLAQSYFTDNDPSTTSGQFTDNRLRLDRLQEMNCDSTIKIPPHIFTYYTKAGNPNYFPNRLSSAIDHWGYYNGATDNTHDQPNIPFERIKFKWYDNVPDNQNPVTDIRVGKSNRETDEESMKLGTLRQVQYPTAGTTTYDYEANTYFDMDGRIALVPKSTLSYNMPDGQCGFSPAPAQSMSFYMTTPSSMYFKAITRKASNYTASSDNMGACGTTPSSLVLNLYNNTTGALVCWSGLSVGNTIESNSPGIIYYKRDTIENDLSTLFSCAVDGGIPPGSYRVEIIGTNAGVDFTILAADLVDANTNKKVGGLRIKRITSSDGVNTAKDVIKTYNYDFDSIPGRSSGLLYSKPMYSYIYKGFINTCRKVTPTYFANYLLMDNTIVPLGSFEGNHIAYTNVKEYYNSNGTGYHNLYIYKNQAAEPFVRLPLKPLQPRIGSGELLEKQQRNSSSHNIASETFFPKTEISDSSALCIKVANYSDLGLNWSVNFLTYYKIATRAYRLDSVVTVQDNITTSASYTYDANLLQKRSETFTNSNGVATTTTYSYPTDLGLTQLIGRNMIFPVQTQTVTGTETKWVKVEFNAAVQPIYLKECLNNADPSVSTNWITRLYIESYNANGMPEKIWRNNALAYDKYTWNNKLLTKKELISPSSGTLTWDLSYILGTSLVNQITDENRLVKKFSYDALMRLSKLQDRMKSDGTDVQTTTDYTYQYAAASVGSYVQTSTSFAGGTTPLVSRQIMDGLGRTKMSMRIGYTLANQNLKSLVTYDAQGRVDLSYQPYESTTTTLDATPASGTLAVQTVYEASPLSRPIQQIAEDGKFVKTQYETNIGSEVRKFSVVSNGDGTNVVSPASTYDASMLYKTIVWNENWNNSPDLNIGRTEIFQDKLGRVVLTRKYVRDTYGTYQNVDTYNVYDDFGKLVMVIPPDATAANAPNGSINLQLVFEYNYDNRNRLTRKKVPNAEWVKFYYNDRDQLTLTQDGNMRTLSMAGILTAISAQNTTVLGKSSKQVGFGSIQEQ